MDVFNLHNEARWDPLKHVERVLGKINEGDVTVACWEAGQVSPHHLHPNCTEIYFCLEGGGIMRTPTRPWTSCRAASWSTRAASCMNMRTDPSARYCFASATATTCQP